MTVARIPSNGGKKAGKDVSDLAADRVRGALGCFFKGKTAPKRLAEATEAVLVAISPLLNLDRPLSKKGGVVMTESASMRNPHTGDYGTKPRSV